LQTNIGERARCLLVDGGEIERRRRPIGEEIADQRGIGGFREIEIGVARLQRERVFVEPDFERLVESAAGLRILRRMDVQVDEARQQELAARLFDEHA